MAQKTSPWCAPLPLRGEVYAVTGGASGIGLATSQMLSRKGATVCIADINPEALKATGKFFAEQELPYMITRVDVSKRSQVDSWVASIIAQHRRLDGAANFADVIGKAHETTTVAEIQDEEWDKNVGVILTGTMYCLRAELRHVVDGGSIALQNKPPLTKAAALENGGREVRVNSVAPGATYTPLMRSSWDFLGSAKDAPFDDPSASKRQGTAQETASDIVFLLRPESALVSGSLYQVDGAWI
ncbi:short chain dehydrogenase family protein [Metarhizium rileyi]|uniref:Short chain dehydrogenase family protein n=1 Tax=Metarhizium rileyi (strain RCEF 4871) TaxID=1649241 RepID=A0A167K9P1_METRR|nr:short chain dehydrogenase family protein [Metarhizium rileyi RCEF 4871]